MTTKTKEVTYASILADADRAQTAFARGKDSVGGSLFILAQGCKDVEQFRVGCESAENDRRSAILRKAEKQENISGADLKAMKKLPHCWSTAKSDIIAMFAEVVDGGFGKHPKEFKSYSALRGELLKLRKERKAGGRKPDESAGNNETTVETASAVVASVKTPLQVTFENFYSRTLQLPEESQTELTTFIEDMIANYESSVTDSDVNDLEEVQIQQSTAKKAA